MVYLLPMVLFASRNDLQGYETQKKLRQMGEHLEQEDIGRDYAKPDYVVTFFCRTKVWLPT